MSKAYEAAGVNLDLGDKVSDMLNRAAVQTEDNRQGTFGELYRADDTFFAARGMPIGPLLDAPDPRGILINLFGDGVGTKVEIAQRVREHSTVSSDLFAMVCEDAAIKGYEPIAILTIINARKLHDSQKPFMEQLCAGYIEAARATGVAIVNGETAELGNLVGGYKGTLLERASDKLRRKVPLNYLWDAALLGAVHTERHLDGRAVQPGDTLVGLKEYGFRSNGLSLARSILRKEFGRAWHRKNEPHTLQTLGEAALMPSTIYTPVFVDAIGGYDLGRTPLATVHAAAHITGGGIPGKLGRALTPSGLGADIQVSTLVPPHIMNVLQSKRDIPDEEIYRVWNMGIGAIAITPDAERFIALANQHGKEAEPIGTVNDSGEITIRSEGTQTRGKKLTYAI